MCLVRRRISWDPVEGGCYSYNEGSVFCRVLFEVVFLVGCGCCECGIVWCVFVWQCSCAPACERGRVCAVSLLFSILLTTIAQQQNKLCPLSCSGFYLLLFYPYHSFLFCLLFLLLLFLCFILSDFYFILVIRRKSEGL